MIRIIKKEEFAEEVLQDAFLKYWDKIHLYDSSKGRLFTWMVNIARNLAIDKLRTKEFSQMQKTEDIGDYVNSGETFNFEELITDGIGVKELLNTLPEDRKWVVEHLYFKGYTQSELAKEFDVPLGTIKTRLRLGMEQLRALLNTT